jgi:hypothetical protein
MKVKTAEMSTKNNIGFTEVGNRLEENFSRIQKNSRTTKGGWGVFHSSSDRLNYFVFFYLLDVWLVML